MKRMIGLAMLLVAAGVALAASDDAWKAAAVYEFEYRVRFADFAPQGAKVAVWVPYPAENRDQKVLGSRIESPWPWRLTREGRFGNRMVFVEGTADPALTDFVMRLRIERRPSQGVPLAEGALQGELRPALYLSPDRLVPLSGLIGKIAAEQSKGLTREGDKVWAFYDYVYRSMSYNKDGAGWGRGDAVWACEAKRGNCTDFHSLFIGLLRSQRIPARFLIGFPIPEIDAGTIGGYHCWAEFYDAQKGWLPVDASEAKKKGLREAYFGTLPNDRIEFTAGRDLTLSPPQHGEPLNYFIYPYAEIDGKPAGEVKREFRFKRLAPSMAS